MAELSGRTKRLVWDTTSTFLRYVPRDSGGVLDSSSPAVSLSRLVAAEPRSLCESYIWNRLSVRFIEFNVGEFT